MAGAEKKELTEEQLKELRDAGYEVTRIRPYDPKDPTTDRRKKQDRRKPAEKKGFFS